VGALAKVPETTAKSAADRLRDLEGEEAFDPRQKPPEAALRLLRNPLGELLARLRADPFELVGQLVEAPGREDAAGAEPVDLAQEAAIEDLARLLASGIERSLVD